MFLYTQEIVYKENTFFKQVGGNLKARDFFESQPDFKPGLTIQQKYNTKAAAMYRQKVSGNFFMSFLSFSLVVFY